jgi:hypothetical protein
VSQQKRGSAGTANQSRVKPDDVDEEEVPGGDDGVRAEENVQIADSASRFGPE